jgi:hypothetical protein
VHGLACADLLRLPAHCDVLQHPGGAAKIMLAGEPAVQLRQRLDEG